MDERQVTLSDLAQIQTDIRELRGQLSTVVESLGHIRVEVAKGLAKGEGDTRVIDAKSIMLWGILVMVASSLMPMVIARLFPSAGPSPVIVNQPVSPNMAPLSVPPPVTR